MALPPGVEPLHVEDDQGAQDEHPDGAQAWHRPVLYVVAGVIGLLVWTIGIYQWGTTNGINKHYEHATGGINEENYKSWEKEVIDKMLNPNKENNAGPFLPVGPNGIWVTKKKTMLAIVPRDYKTSSFWKTSRKVHGNLDIRVLGPNGAVDKSIQFGWTSDTNFKHIGIGMEGASNVNQIGEGEFKGRPLGVEFGIHEDEKIRAAFLSKAQENIASWSGETGAPTMEQAENILVPLKGVLKSVKDAIEKQGFGDLVVLLFEQPQGHQIVFTAADVFKQTGQYYIRNNGINTHFADPPSDGNWYCAIPMKNDKWENYLVTSYGLNNLLYDNMAGKTKINHRRMLREDVGQEVLTNLTLP